jgi:NAD(P)-dependent dehydrogenase (short-subunit alcohol dehydrogenase family)
VGKAILESGGDVVFVDIAPSPSEQTWSTLSPLQDPNYHLTPIETIQEIATANGTRAWYHAVNVTDADSIPPVFDTIRNQIRHPIRGLVACAGISGECDACDYPIEVFRKILDVNITGTFTITQAVAKEMHRANVTGSIVLIASA